MGYPPAVPTVSARREPHAIVPPDGRFRGSISFVPSVVGLIIAGEVIKDLVGVH